MRVKVNGLSLSYEVHGEKGDWVVLCHGLGAGLRSMRGTAQRWSDKYRVLVWDNRGIGESDTAPPGEDYSIATHAGDLAHLMDALGIERAVIQGTSWGGVLALRFALDYPEKTRALVVDSSSAEVNERAAQNWIARGELMLKEGPAGARNAPGGLRDAPAGDAPAQAAPARSSVPAGPPPDPRAYYETCKAVASLFERPMSPELGRISVPTLAIVGENDQTAGVGGTVKLARAIANARLMIVKDCGHGVAGQAPEVFRQAVEELIATAP